MSYCSYSTILGAVNVTMTKRVCLRVNHRIKEEFDNKCTVIVLYGDSTRMNQESKMKMKMKIKLHFERTISRSSSSRSHSTMFPYSILSLVLQLALLLVTLSTTSHVVAASASSVSISESSPKISFDGIIQRISKQPPGQQIQSALAQCTPALRTRTIKKRIENSTNNNRYDNSNSNLQALWKDTSIETVSSVKIKANKAKIRIQNLLEYTGSTGFYYGIDPERMIPKNNDGGQRKPRPPKLEDSMAVALEELKQMRLEMERMRIEMQQLKQKMVGDGDEDSSYYKDDQFSAENKAISLRKRRKEAEKLAAEIESWANTMLQEGAEDGWTPVECSKLIRASVNGMERTTAHLKWMADSRAEKADKEDQSKHPCIKCSSTIDAPLELVCAYLSQPNTSVDYNDVVEKHKDLEEISPHAKICWSASPQILFVKPREYITFCHHRWKSDGTQVIVNQACEHPKYPLEKMEKEGKSCRGYALRGANCKCLCY